MLPPPSSESRGAPAPPVLLHSAAEVDRWRGQSASPHTVAFVPTMGALHEGHLALAHRGRELADRVIVSIFVNPLQFGAGEDFDRYPRTLDSDVVALAGLADAVFAPDVTEIYPPDVTIERVESGPVGDTYEGAARPGHFDGMLTVVARLFRLVTPDVAVFGQKDAQQVFLVRRLISDHFPQIRLEVVPTVRESDGLAKSSRNRFLTEEDRQHARVLSRALARASDCPAVAVPEMRQMLLAEPGVQLDYVDAVDARTFVSVLPTDPDQHFADLTYIVAARVGATRLLDTVDVFSPN